MTDSSTTSAPISSSLPAIINQIQFHYSINPKLDGSNFLLWRSQVLPVIRGHGLISFLDGTALTSSSSSQQSDVWNRQDQLILAWLLSNLGTDILPQAISCDTSADLWRMLNSTYSAQSSSRVLELKRQLQSLKKGNLTCTEYLNRLKSVALQLRSIGCDIGDQDFSLYLFAGLPPEYNSLVTSLTSQSTSFSIADLHGHLLNFEARLASQALCDQTAHLTLGDSSRTVPVPYFISNGSGSGFNYFGPAIPSPGSSNPLLPTPNSTVLSTSPAPRSNSTAPILTDVLAPALLSTLPWQTQQQLATAYISQQLNRSNHRGGRGRGRGHGRGKSYTFSGASQGRGNGGYGGPGSTAGKGPTVTQTCQICSKIGHVAKECWYRYNDDPTPAPQVNLAEPSSSPTSDWFLDSGASSHIVPDLI